MAFARHWKLLAEGFVAGVDSVDGMLVRYEDLVSGNIDLALVAEHVGVEYLDTSVLEARVDRPRSQKAGKKNTRTPLPTSAKTRVPMVGGSTNRKVSPEISIFL